MATCEHRVWDTEDGSRCILAPHGVDVVHQYASTSGVPGAPKEEA